MKIFIASEKCPGTMIQQFVAERLSHIIPSSSWLGELTVTGPTDLTKAT